MSYVNFLRHDRYGKLWYEAELRNWWAMGHTAEQNRARGPLVELRLHGYLISSGGATLSEALARLLQLLDWYAAAHDELPIDHPSTLWERARHWYAWRHPIKYVRVRRSLRAQAKHRVRLP